jgi:sugar phosphate isomerase/epimerase
MARAPRELDAARIRELAGDFNLAIACVSTGQLRKEDGLQLCHLDRAERERAVARTKEVIDFTREVGASQVNIGTLRGHLPSSDFREGAREAAAESINELLDYALKREVGIALEPQNRFISNWLNSVGETLDWMSRFRHSNLSLLFDAYHALFEEASVYAALIRAFPRISHVQVADSNRLAPGGGQVQFGELLRVLAALDYHGYVSVEVLPVPSGAEAATRAARCLLPLIEDMS